MKTLLEVFGEYEDGPPQWAINMEARLVSNMLDDLSPEEKVAKIKEYAREVAQDALNRAAQKALDQGEIEVLYPEFLAEYIKSTEIILP